jgi:hypothetical protein
MMAEHPLDNVFTMLEEAESAADRGKTNDAISKIANSLWHITQAIDFIQQNQTQLAIQLVRIESGPRATAKPPRL